MAKSATQFPFLYKNHGALLLESFTKAAGAYMGFVKAPTRAQVEKIAASCPIPIRGFTAWTDTLLSTESPGDVFDWLMLEHYGTEADKQKSAAENWATFEQPSADKFSRDVERWVMATHAIAPLAWFVGPCAGGDDDDEWDVWTRANLAEPLLEFIEGYVKRNKLPEETDYEPDEVVKLSKTTIACLLQEFDGQGLKIGKDLKPRIAKLRKAFPI